MGVKKKVSASINSFIDKGAKVKGTKEKMFKNVLVRMPTIILEDIDCSIEKNPLWITRTQWIVEAINARLEEEKDV